jgi:glycosyltransferase involved in cell wall biosynthesis
MKMRDALGMVLASVRAPSLVNQFKDYDLILAHSQPSSWLAFNAKKRFRIPYFCYLHQPNRFLYPRKIDLAVGYDTNLNYEVLNNIHNFTSFIEKLDKLSIFHADQVLVNSNWIKKSIDRIYSVDSNVCYPGVDHKFFRKTREKVDDAPYLLSTNRHYPQKRLDYIILSLPLILEEHPDVKCVITGSFTKYTLFLKGLVNRLKVGENVVFTEHINEKDLLETYQNAYLYAFSSPEEDFGLGPLEAGACGVPAVVWDYAGPRETVVDFKTGFRAKPYDVSDFALKQIRLLDAPALRNEMGDNASEYVKDNFTWEKHVSKLAVLFSSY